MAWPHPWRPEPWRTEAQFIRTGKLGLRAPLGRPYEAGLCSRGPHRGKHKPGGTHTLTKEVLLVGFWPRKLRPPQVSVLWPAPKEA